MEDITLEKRLKNIKNIYKQLDQLDNYLPNEAAKQIKHLVLDDKELAKLIDELDDFRAPRILLVGRTGFGKSSLINALVGEYVAPISDSVSCTTKTVKYTTTINAGASIEILDTRGISESKTLDESITAEEQIKQDVIKFNPDIALFVLNCTSRDGIDEDAKFMKTLSDKYRKYFGVNLPVIAVLNKADSVQPVLDTYPFSKEKKENIQDIKQNIISIFDEVDLQTVDIIPVSTVMSWTDASGKDYTTAKQINALSEQERKLLTINVDHRYQIPMLKRAIEKNIQSEEGSAGLKLVFHYEETMKITCKNFINSFSVIGGALVGTTIPVADYFLLVSLESVEVALIMALSGRDFSIDSAKEFIGGLVGVAGAGQAFKQIAKYAVKFVPVSGNVINGVVAGSGIKTIGNSAVSYFLLGHDLEEVQKKYQLASKGEKAKAKLQDGLAGAMKTGDKLTKQAVKAGNKALKDASKNGSKALKQVSKSGDKLVKDAGKLANDTTKGIAKAAGGLFKKKK